MAESAYPFDTVPVYEAQWGEMAQLWARSGVVGTTRTTSDPALRVTLGTGLTINIAAGPAWVRGHYYTSDTTITRTGTTNGSTNPRIDRVVLRLDTAANTITPVIVQGTPAASPTPPALTRTATVYEIPLARMTCPGSGSAQNYTSLVDERSFVGPGGLVADVGGPSTTDILPAEPGALWWAPNLGRLAVGRTDGTWGLLAGGAYVSTWLTETMTLASGSDGPLTLLTLTLPDIGCAYRVWAMAHIVITAPSGTRGDIYVRLDSPTGTDVTTPGIGSSIGDNRPAICVPLSYGPITGQHTLYLVMQRIFGTGTIVADHLASGFTAKQIPA